MKREIALSFLLFLGVTLVMADVAPQIFNIKVDSSWDGVVVKNEMVHIRWAHSAYYTGAGQTCRIFCGDQVISPAIPVINKDFVWTGGRKADGTYLPQGKSYRITIENADYDALNGPEIALIDELPKFTITAPPNGQTLTIGSDYTIRWTHSAYFNLFNTAKLLLLLNILDGSEPYIAEVPVVNDQFAWKVGKLRDGSVAAPGDYRLSAEQNEYWNCNEVSIKLVKGLIGPIFRLNVLKIWIDKLPDCPMCFSLDPKQIKFDSEGPLVFDVELLRNGVVLAKLGRFGPRLAVPGPVKIVLEQEPRGRMMKRLPPKYELRFLSTKGEVLHREVIQLEMAK